MVNLARQLGGSFGTAIIGTYLTNQTQFHRVNLLGNIRLGNAAYEERVQALVSRFISYGYDRAAAQGAALGTISGSVMRQATMMAYNNCWIFIMIVFVATAPAILLLRKPRAGAAHVDAH